MSDRTENTLTAVLIALVLSPLATLVLGIVGIIPVSFFV